MGQVRWLGVAAIVVGVVLALLGVFAYRLGLSALPTFGWKKLLVVVLGCVALGGGILLLRQPANEDDLDDEDDLAGRPAEGSRQ